MLPNRSPLARAAAVSGPCRLLLIAVVLFLGQAAVADGTRLLRQPTISDTQIAFIYGGDLWIAPLAGGEARRLTSTPAVESDPHFSPDGARIAFSSNRSGDRAVYLTTPDGGMPARLTWHPDAAWVRGWTPDGKRILYASARQTAPTGYDRLWTVAADGGPSTLLPAPWATSGSYSADGARIAIDPMSRWDGEWRGYRGGQNTPLILLNLKDLNETLLPNERTTDTQPVWIGDTVYFLSDRDGVVNIWSYDPATAATEQLTRFTGADVKWLTGRPGMLAFERDGFLHTLTLPGGDVRQLSITVRGDFPWAEPRWEDVGERVSSAALSPTGKRAIMEARGEIFTVPVEHGDTRNLTNSSGAADRAPVWSPKGEQVAWFSDAGGEGYALFIGPQDGLGEPRRIAIGESKMAWEPAWSPDGAAIAFVDDDTRIRVVDVAKGSIRTADVAGTNLERGGMGLTWSPDSRWLAYATTGANRLSQIRVWSAETGSVHILSDSLADAYAPAWDRDHRHLYFLASTDVALGSGWANTSSMQARPEYGVYVLVLRDGDPSPFPPRSDEEKAPASDGDDGKDEKTEDDGDDAATTVRIDFGNLDRRTIALPMPVRRYALTRSGPAGSVFVGERQENASGLVLQKFDLEKRKASEFASGVRDVSLSADGKKMLVRKGSSWTILDATKESDNSGTSLSVKLMMRLDRLAEWRQMFEEAWRYQRDFFYDPGMHGRDWAAVRERYAPLVPWIRHRADLTWVLDQMNGELSVGHSFVFGGDYPEVEKSRVGLLGADLVAERGRWRIVRIYTAESWNPTLTAPLARPGLTIREGDWLVGVNGVELTAADSPYRLLDGTAGRQTVLHVNDRPAFEGARQEIVEPIDGDRDLRRRAWVEDNRRRVQELSNGRLAYVWIPNTGGPGVVSFNRYFFAQQDKEGAVIDERFNGGGLLDDYMVDLMNRTLRAAITNEVPGGAPMRLPAGILGPKVLLINELAGSGGDFFPWVFRQQEIGPLIGMRTWGGLVKSSVHYRLVDGGALTAPDNAVFDPIHNRWIAENEGVPPDIEVRLDAATVAQGRDPQLERAVQEALRLIEAQPPIKVTPPPFPTPAAPSEPR